MIQMNASDFRHFLPFLRGGGGFYGGFDEGHADDAVGDGGEIVLFRLFAGDLVGDRGGGGGVDVGEGFEEGFGVAGGEAGGTCGGGDEITAAAGEDLAGFVVGFQNEFVGIFLVPFESGAGAVDADAEVVFLAGGNLGGEKDAFG